MLTRDGVLSDVAGILECDSSELAMDKNLIDCGLDSIRLMSLVEKWRADGARVSFVDLVENPTLAGWLDALRLP